MAAVRLEKDPHLINQIANADGVREFLRPDGKPMDWTPLAQQRPAESGVVILSNGEDAVAAFEITAPGIYQSHTMFAPTCRGRKAIDTAREMVGWMFDHGAEIVWGSTPRANRQARLFNRWIGATPLPSSDDEEEVFEIRKPH